VHPVQKDSDPSSRSTLVVAWMLPARYAYVHVHMHVLVMVEEIRRAVSARLRAIPCSNIQLSHEHMQCRIVMVMPEADGCHFGRE
jgi:hypothetical protein